MAKSKKRPPKPARPTPLNPAALTLGEAAELLTRTSRAIGGERTVTVSDLQADVAAGAPTNADGTLHLIHYGAWLASRAD